MPIRDGQTPTNQQVDRFLRTVASSTGPVFVHCGAGVRCRADRLHGRGLRGAYRRGDLDPGGAADPRGRPAPPR
ncbi:fused DSP-PTPase phosphatase/NAD kinase-like protein, partial [Streptomyces scabichelini]|uniref:fused DSP-PTPase phosphatase/NAD kinase-like protein n=1 Tax=Streptomyces scabichelini TaxID=2711217 RepID=UPI003B97CC1A